MTDRRVHPTLDSVHELSICAAIVETVINHAAGRPVERVHLRIGHFKQVVPDTLQFCWRMQTEDGPLRAASLDITHVPATVHCLDCGSATTLEAPVLICGTCDSRRVDLVTGEEFLIESIDVSAPEEVG